MLDNDKVNRVLTIYTKLVNGSVISKSEEATLYNVNERTIQRDIDDIRKFLDQKMVEEGRINNIVYDRNAKGYRLETIYRIKFTNSEILAICKILLDSRAFTKSEMLSLLDKLLDCCIPETNRRSVTELIRNEAFHYIEPHHHTVFIDKMWEIGKAIQCHRKIKIYYKKLYSENLVERILQPLAIMFSDHYFYMIAFIDDLKDIEKEIDYKKVSPTIYRIDRIHSLDIMMEQFHLPYASRFEEGEFRKRIPFMFGGKLEKVIFKYSGLSIETVLDKLPTAQIIRHEGNIYTIMVETYGRGFEMWAKSQGEDIFDIKWCLNGGKI